MTFGMVTGVHYSSTLSNMTSKFAHFPEARLLAVGLLNRTAERHGVRAVNKVSNAPNQIFEESGNIDLEYETSAANC